MVYDDMGKMHDEHMRGWYNAMQAVYDRIEEMKEVLGYDEETLNNVQAFLRGAMTGRDRYE